MSSGIIWGGLLILLGLSIISKAIFGIAIPFVRITLALMIIYVGITILLGSLGYKKAFCCSFKSYNTKVTKLYKDHQSYSTVFSEGTIDVSEIALTERHTFIEISTVFGKTTLLLNPSIATKLVVNNVFSKTTFPDGTEFAAMGEQVSYFGPEQSEPNLVIKANVVFGSLSIEKK